MDKLQRTRNPLRFGKPHSCHRRHTLIIALVLFWNASIMAVTKLGTDLV